MNNTPVGETLAKKLMIGTDWYMTEMVSCSPRDRKLAWDSFWPKFAEERDPHIKRSILWRWATRERHPLPNLHPPEQYGHDQDGGVLFRR